MYCNECGNSLPDGVERCPVCGSKVKVQYANNGMNDLIMVRRMIRYRINIKMTEWDT